MAGVTFEIYLFHTLIMKGLALVINSMDITPLVGEIMMVIGTFFISWIIAVEYKKMWKWIIKKDNINSLIDNRRVWKLH